MMTLGRLRESNDAQSAPFAVTRRARRGRTSKKLDCRSMEGGAQWAPTPLHVCRLFEPARNLRTTMGLNANRHRVFYWRQSIDSRNFLEAVWRLFKYPNQGRVCTVGCEFFAPLMRGLLPCSHSVHFWTHSPNPDPSDLDRGVPAQ